MTAPGLDGSDDGSGKDLPADRGAIKSGTFVAPDEAATQALAAALAVSLRPGDVVCLHGDLGAGKTAFARAAIRAMTGDPDEEVPSPTFTLVQTYATARGTVWHFDLYRLSGPEEVYELGWEDATVDGIVLLEWPDRLGSLLPARRIDVTIQGGGGRGDGLTGAGGRRIDVAVRRPG